MRARARCHTLRRILSHALLVFGGTLAATAAAWLLSASQASAGELDHGGENAEHPVQQAGKSTVDNVAGRLGDTARSTVRHAGSAVDTVRHATSATPSEQRGHTRSAPEAATDRAHETGAAVRATATATTSGVRKTAENAGHGLAGTADALGDRISADRRDGPRVPASPEPAKLPELIAKHRHAETAGGSSAAGGSGSVTQGESDSASHKKRHAGSAPAAHAHPSAGHRDTVRHGTMRGTTKSFGRTAGSATTAGRANTQARHDADRSGSQRHGDPEPLPAGSGTANGGTHQFGGNSGVLPDPELPARDIVIGVLHSADEYTPVAVNRQPGASPG